MGREPSVLVLGIGNLLWADEGFGVRTVEEFHRRYDAPANVRVMDGGTQGIYLLDFIRETDILVVFDAIDFGDEPGSLKMVEGDEVPAFLGTRKLSLHQTGFQEVLAMADMVGDYPDHLLLVGVQPVELEDYGGSLRPAVKRCMDDALALAVNWLASLGVSIPLRAVPLGPEVTLTAAAIALTDYEAGRPDADEACRIGDDRLLADGRFAAPADFDAEVAAMVASVPASASQGQR